MENSLSGLDEDDFNNYSPEFKESGCCMQCSIFLTETAGKILGLGGLIASGLFFCGPVTFPLLVGTPAAILTGYLPYMHYREHGEIKCFSGAGFCTAAVIGSGMSIYTGFRTWNYITHLVYDPQIARIAGISGGFITAFGALLYATSRMLRKCDVKPITVNSVFED